MSTSHLKALLLKNFYLWKRSKIGSFCELFLPIILVVGLSMIRFALTHKPIPQTSYVQDVEAASSTGIYALMNADYTVLNIMINLCDQNPD